MQKNSKGRKPAVTRVDVYDRVTQIFIDSLNNNVVPWHKPWNTPGSGPPRSMSTRRPYRGVNTLLLSLTGSAFGYTSSFWGTYRQIAALGGQVRKGEQGTDIVLWKSFEKDETDAVGAVVTRSIPFARMFKVFNAGQADGLPAEFFPSVEGTEPLSRISHADELISEYVKRSGVKVRHGSSAASYSARLDEVALPDLDHFDNPSSYYYVNFHELAHSTGHKDRLNRPGVAETHLFGDPVYSFEELVAEQSAGMIGTWLGLEPAYLENSAAYIQGWLKALAGDSRMVIKAAGAAQKAADLIIGDDLGAEAEIVAETEETEEVSVEVPVSVS